MTCPICKDSPYVLVGGGTCGGVLRKYVGVPIKQIDPDDTEWHVRPLTSGSIMQAFGCVCNVCMKQWQHNLDSRSDDCPSDQGDNDMQELLDAVESSGVHGLTAYRYEHELCC